jgi:hypothetical protein
MSERFEVSQYSIDELKRLLAEKSGAPPHIIDAKLHSLYFEEYFNALNAQTIVIEDDYVDRDFLEDFAGYYVRCFQNYTHRCIRLHFFAIPFNSQDFEELLALTGSCLELQTLQQAYLGFIVVKPLLQTVIGRTCLKTYPSENGRRHFPITRDYEASLFGLALKVKTLAFQEQDSVVAACATSALWSIFQGTGMLFHHPLPSPLEITKTAAPDPPSVSRILPNHGLTLAQMTRAVHSIGLEPQLVNVSESAILKSTSFAYLRGKIPILMNFLLVDMSSSLPEVIAMHAVAVTGYSIGHTKAVPYKSSEFLLKASRIDKIYVHDDQVGPFARMVCDGIKISIAMNGINIDRDTLSTSWKGRNGSIGYVRAVPDVFLIPLYHKIRIPFGVIHDILLHFDSLINALRNNNAIPLIGPLEWDIHLTTVNDLKQDISSLEDFVGDYRKEVLLESLPRFMWRATACFEDKRILDLLFDATDIEHGQFFIRAIEYDSAVSTVLRGVSKASQLIQAAQTQAERGIFEWFAKQPSP